MKPCSMSIRTAWISRFSTRTMIPTFLVVGVSTLADEIPGRKGKKRARPGFEARMRPRKQANDLTHVRDIMYHHVPYPLQRGLGDKRFSGTQ